MKIKQRYNLKTKRDISHPVSVNSNLEVGNKFHIYEHVLYIYIIHHTYMLDFYSFRL